MYLLSALPRRILESIDRFSPTESQIYTIMSMLALGRGIFRISVIAVGLYLCFEVGTGLIHHFHLLGFLWSN